MLHRRDVSTLIEEIFKEIMKEDDSSSGPQGYSGTIGTPVPLGPDAKTQGAALSSQAIDSEINNTTSQINAIQSTDPASQQKKKALQYSLRALKAGQNKAAMA